MYERISARMVLINTIKWGDLAMHCVAALSQNRFEGKTRLRALRLGTRFLDLLSSSPSYQMTFRQSLFCRWVRAQTGHQRQTDGRTGQDRQTQRQTDTETDRQTERQTDTETDNESRVSSSTRESAIWLSPQRNIRTQCASITLNVHRSA